MRTVTAFQPTFFPSLTAEFPSTRYQGSKAKLVEWIWEQIGGLDFATCLDAFGGTGAVAYRLKQAGKRVTYNDLLRFNYYVGQALIENSHIHLDAEEVDWLLHRHSGVTYPSFVQDSFPDIYFTDAENAWIDQTVTNIRLPIRTSTRSLFSLSLKPASSSDPITCSTEKTSTSAWQRWIAHSETRRPGIDLLTSGFASLWMKRTEPSLTMARKIAL
jgi:hypothetical protein